MAKRLLLWSLGAVLTLGLGGSRPRAGETVLRLTEQTGHAWEAELVSYPLRLGAGELSRGAMHLQDDGGAVVAHQLTDVQEYNDGSLHSARLWFIVAELPAGGRRTYRLVAGRRQAAAAPPLTLTEDETVVQITTDRFGVRLTGGRQVFAEPRAPTETPGPLQAVRLRDGGWVGRGWWQAEHDCEQVVAQVLERGPVFALVRQTFAFSGGRTYTATYRVIAGQDHMYVKEEFDLGDPARFVIPEYSEKERLMWDWWGGTHGRAESPNNALFSFHDPQGFHPTVGRWYGHHASIPEKNRGARGQGAFEYDLDYGQDRLDVVLNSWLQWGDDESLYYTAWEAEKPQRAISFAAVRPSQWLHPDIQPHDPPRIRQFTSTNNMGIWVGKEPDIYLRLPVNQGARAWVLATPDAQADLAETPGAPDRVSEYLARHNFPLDKVKDWRLDWTPTRPWPRLFVRPGDMESLRARMEAMPDDFVYMQHRPVFRFIAEGREKDARAAYGRKLAALRKLRDAALGDIGIQTGSLNHQQWGSELQTLATEIDPLLAWEKMPAEDRQRLYRLMALAMYVAWDPDHFPYRDRGFAWGTANQGSIYMTGRGLFAGLLAEHPDGPEWIARASRFSIWDLERYLNEDGVAVECPGYVVTAVSRNLVVLQANRNRVDLGRLTPRLEEFVEWRAQTMPPPDPRFGQRTLVPLGDTPYSGDGPAGLAAMTLLDRAPETARQALWLWRRSGKPRSGRVHNLFTIDDTLEDAAPAFYSKRFAGFGAVMRTGTGRPDETYLCYHHGSFAWGHYDADQGQIVFYAKGAPLLQDFASQYVPSINQSCFHNTISFDHEEEVERKCPGRDHPDCWFTGKRRYLTHDTEPFLFWEYEDSLGDVVAFADLDSAAYSRGEHTIDKVVETPYSYEHPHYHHITGPERRVEPFTWSRQIVLVKDADPAGPNYFFVRDSLGGNRELEPAFNLWSLTEEIRLDGNRAFLPGQLGVDLEVWIAEPSNPRIQIGGMGHRNAGSLKKTYNRLHEEPFEEKQNLLRIFQQPGGSFGVAVYPRRDGQPQPDFAPLPDSVPGVKVILPDQTHWIVASPQAVTLATKDFRFHGTAGVVKQYADGRADLSLLAAGTIRYGDSQLQADNAAVLSVDRPETP